MFTEVNSDLTFSDVLWYKQHNNGNDNNQNYIVALIMRPGFVDMHKNHLEHFQNIPITELKVDLIKRIQNKHDIQTLIIIDSTPEKTLL